LGIWAWTTSGHAGWFTVESLTVPVTVPPSGICVVPRVVVELLVTVIFSACCGFNVPP
jgi:hypothetical protein